MRAHLVEKINQPAGRLAWLATERGGGCGPPWNPVPSTWPWLGWQRLGRLGRGARAVAAGERGHHLGTAEQDIDGDVVRLERATVGGLPAAATGACGGGAVGCRSDRQQGIESKGLISFYF